MLAIIKFWLPLFAILVSWELALWYPKGFWYALGLAIGASLVLVSFLNPGSRAWRYSLPDRLAFMVFVICVFWWFFWLDFAWLKYFLPVVFWAVTVYAFREIRSQKELGLPPHWRLALFLGGTFFAGSVCFGLLTVLGWPLWSALVIFLAALAVFSWSAMVFLEADRNNLIRGFLLLILLGAEIFSVIVWLPFTEATLGLILTIIMLGTYDLLKYLTKPELIVRRIIIKKVVVYIFFLVLVLASTPWQ